MKSFKNSIPNQMVKIYFQPEPITRAYQMQASQWATSPKTQTSRTRTAAPYSR